MFRRNASDNNAREEKEVIMTGQRNSVAGFDASITAIPET